MEKFYTALQTGFRTRIISAEFQRLLRFNLRWSMAFQTNIGVGVEKITILILGKINEIIICSSLNETFNLNYVNH